MEQPRQEVDCKSSLRKNLEFSIDIFMVLLVIGGIISVFVESKKVAVDDPNTSNGDVYNSSSSNYTATDWPTEADKLIVTEIPTMIPTNNYFKHDPPLAEHCDEIAQSDHPNQNEPTWWGHNRNNILQRSIELEMDVTLVALPDNEDGNNETAITKPWIQDITKAMNRYMVPILLGCNRDSHLWTDDDTVRKDLTLLTANQEDETSPLRYAISNATIVHGHAGASFQNQIHSQEPLLHRIILTIHCLLKGYEENEVLTSKIDNILHDNKHNNNDDISQDKELVNRLNLSHLLQKLSVIQIVPTRSATLKAIIGDELQQLLGVSDEKPEKFFLHPQAFHWLTETDTWKMDAEGGVHPFLWLSRYVLAIIYYENVFVGDVVNQTDHGSSKFRSWLSSSESVCEWSGMECSSNEQGDTVLSRMELDWNNLTGHVPSDIGLLTHLTYLNLYQNGLTGPIPSEIGQLTSLKALFLASNLLTGSIPSEVGKLTDLTRLSLASNGFSGPLPKGIGQLTALKALLIYENKLEGQIPSEIGQLTALTRLLATLNDFGGSIPSELFKLTEMVGLFLDENKLTGYIPSEIGMLTALSQFSIYRNSLSGSIPPEMSRLTGLTELYLNENELTGSIPTEMSTMTNLRSSQCQISDGNLLSDTINLPSGCT